MYAYVTMILCDNVEIILNVSTNIRRAITTTLLYFMYIYHIHTL